LRLALDRVGYERVVYGSDNPPVPFPLSRSIGVVESLGLPRDQEEAILGGNARALFRGAGVRGHTPGPYERWRGRGSRR
jgi:predicted TIM-barrel fold metal-dependent hydrolase